MNHSIFKMMLILPLVAVGTSYANSASVDPSETASYWSDEAAGGGSYLGVDTCDVTAERVGPLQLKEERGVEVTMVDQDAPAGKAGVREHDVIFTLNDTAIANKTPLHRVIAFLPPRAR